mmetsp:Transcript_26812/g.31516  ORF Transcript_26812/g.31516 Transcript_26812/m.31516 type:complete len:121 (-) Transcript_26812:576-938(-)
MKELPSWQIHLNKLKQELGVQEDKWDHREEEQQEMERKREEIRKLEEEMERVKAENRRAKIEIIHEDQIEPKSASKANVIMDTLEGESKVVDGGIVNGIRIDVAMPATGSPGKDCIVSEA